MNDLQKNLLDWAEKTVSTYNKIALSDSNRIPAFYTQSPLNVLQTSPEVMVIGINPGSIGTFQQQLSHSHWNLNGKGMSANQLLSGNYCIADDEKSTCWEHFWEKGYGPKTKAYFSKMVNNPFGKEKPINYCLTNLTFFGTARAKDLNGLKITDTYVHTLELITILNPKKIILYSGASAAKIIRGYIINHPEINDYSINPDIIEIPLSERSGKFVKGKLCGIRYLGVPHPSAHLSHNDREEVKTLIADFMVE